MMMQKEAPKMDRAMRSHGYMDYSPELVASALKDGQRIALFFAAPWCPSCRSLDKAIQSDLGSIGMDTLIVRVDYDSSTELKKKYGVVTQHTTVVLGSDGSLASKKLGARTVAEVVGK
jgi:thiol-disulfide isomerase/thioredoxin